MSRTTAASGRLPQAQLRSLGAGKGQILRYLVLPANYGTLLNVLRVNVGLSWVGVIMGEFLVSKAGLGYLIVYGSQVFNMDLVMAGIVLLALCAVGPPGTAAAGSAPGPPPGIPRTW